MTPGVSDCLGKLADLIETDPMAAAADLERMAQQLLLTAGALRAKAAASGRGGSEIGRGGCADRVRVMVVGPEGRVSKDTGGRYG